MSQAGPSNYFTPAKGVITDTDDTKDVEIVESPKAPSSKPSAARKGIRAFFPQVAKRPQPQQQDTQQQNQQPPQQPPSQQPAATPTEAEKRSGGEVGTSGRQPEPSSAKRKKTDGDAARAARRKLATGANGSEKKATETKDWEDEAVREAEYARLKPALHEEFKWLVWDPQRKVLLCSDCGEFAPPGSKSQWCNDGCKDIRRGRCVDHLVSDGHSKALANKVEQRDWATAQEKSWAAAQLGMCALACAAYTTAKTMQPITSYTATASVMAASGTPGVKPDGPDISDTAGKQLMGIISEVMDSRMLEVVQASPFVGIMIDESTDRSVTSHIAIYVTYLTSAFDVEIKFMQLEDLEGAPNAQNITQVLLDALQENGLDMRKVACFTSDGCSVMTGHRNGVAVRLQEDNPHMLAFTCVAHKLALCISSLFQDNELLVSYDKLLSDIAAYFSKSHARREGLEEVQAMLAEPVLGMLKKHNIRWLSRSGCIRRIRKCLLVLLHFFKQEAEASSAAAYAIYNQLRSADFIILTTALDDVMGLTSALSQLFQSRDFSFLNVRSLIDTSLGALRAKYTWTPLPPPAQEPRGRTRGQTAAAMANVPLHAPTPGSAMQLLLRELCEGEDGEYTWRGHPVLRPTLKANTSVQGDGSLLYESLAVAGDISAIVQLLCTELEGRFPQSDLSVAAAFSIFHPANLAAAPTDEAALMSYGQYKFETLASFFGSERGDYGPLLDPVALSFEWDAVKMSYVQTAKAFMKEQGKDHNIRRFWKAEIPALLQHGSKNLAALLQIMLIIQPATAEVEHRFSAMNYIKDTHRTRLALPTLDVLMRIAINGPDLTGFEAEGYLPSVLKIWNAGNRVPQRSSHAPRRNKRAKQHIISERTVDAVSGIALPI